MNKSGMNEIIDAPSSSKSQRIRDELWSTFFHEMDDLLEKLESQLLDIEKNLHSEDLIAGLFRTMHTLKGTAGMMGLSNVETLAHKAEDIMDLVRAHEMDLNPHIIDLMFSTLDSLKVAQGIITETRQDINGEQNIELIAALKSSAVPTPSATALPVDTTSPVDASIWQQIHQECGELLDQIESAALAFEKGYHASFDQLFRSLHSLKSAVDFAHLVNATKLVHRCEDLVGLLREQSETQPKGIIDTVLAVTDLIRHMMDNPKKSTTVTADLSAASIQPLLQQIDAQLLAISGNVFSEYTSEQLTALTTNSAGVLLNKKIDPLPSVDPSYWQDYFLLINENLQSMTQAISKTETSAIDTNTIEDCREEMLFASKQLQLNAAIEAIQAFNTTDNASLSKLNDFFKTLNQQLLSDQELPSTTPQAIVNDPIDIESFFNVIWKSLGSLRKIGQASPINKTLMQAEVAHLTQHCQHISPLDIEHNLQAWSQVFGDEAVDVVKISGLINDLYTYFWDQEDQLNQGDINLLQRLTPILPATDNTPIPFTAMSEINTSMAAEAPDECADNEFPEAVFIIDFLESIHQQLPEIQRHHQDYQATGNLSSAWFSCIGNIANKSQALGFNNLTILLNHTLNTARQSQLSADDLSAFELQLFAQLCTIGEALPEGARNELAEIANLTTVFKQWHSEHCFQELALLINHIVELQNSDISTANDRLHAMQLHLQSLLFSCQYWQLTQCEQAVLLLIDLLHRAEVEPSRLTPSILQEILQLGQHLGQCFDATISYGNCDEDAVSQWIMRLTSEVQTRHHTQQVLIAQRFCQSLHLPTCLMTAFNEADYEKIGHAIMQQRPLFLVYSDIEDDDALVNAFFNLLETPELSVITNATDYVQQRSVFYFLISASLHTQQLTQALHAIDPSQRRLTLTPLTFNPANTQNRTAEQISSTNNTVTNTTLSQPFDQQDLADLDLLQQALGQLVSIKTHMQQSSEAIKKFHLGEDILQHLQPVMSTNQTLPLELQRYLQSFTEIIDQWMQSQEALNTVADQLQDSLKNLQQAPLQPLLNRVQHWFQQQILNPADISPENVETNSLNTISTQFHPTQFQFILPEQDAATPPVMLNKTQMPALEAVLQQLITTCIRCKHTQPHVSIHLQAHNIERGTQCTLTLTPALDIAQDTTEQKTEQQSVFDFADLQPRLAENNIQIQTQFEHNQLQQINVTLADDHRIIEGLIVAADNLHYVIPTHMIKRLVNRNDVELMSVSAAGGSRLVKVEQQLLPLSFFPKQILQSDNVSSNADTQTRSQAQVQSILLVIESADKQQALLIDELLGFQQVVVTPLQGQLQQCRGFSGCCVLGKDKVAMVFDAATAVQ